MNHHTRLHLLYFNIRRLPLSWRVSLCGPDHCLWIPECPRYRRLSPLIQQTRVKHKVCSLISAHSLVFRSSWRGPRRSSDVWQTGILMFSSFQKIILNRNHLALSGMQSDRSGVWREQAWGNNSETASQTFLRCFPIPPASCPGRTLALPLPKRHSAPGNCQSRVLSSRGAQADGLQRNEWCRGSAGPVVSPDQTAALLLRQTPGCEGHFREPVKAILTL